MVFSVMFIANSITFCQMGEGGYRKSVFMNKEIKQKRENN
jgi:hypothetical protein